MKSGAYLSNISFPHLPLVCIYMEGLSFELQLGHLVPVQRRARQQVRIQK